MCLRSKSGARNKGAASYARIAIDNTPKLLQDRPSDVLLLTLALHNNPVLTARADSFGHDNITDLDRLRRIARQTPKAGSWLEILDML